jgi:hypothetical protein
MVNKTGYYLHEGMYRFLPPVKEVQVNHERGGGNNKIVGSEWDSYNHGERCYDFINNAGNAILNARFIVNISTRYVVGADTGFMRHIMGLRIKIGNYYLVRNQPIVAYDSDSDNLRSLVDDPDRWQPMAWTTTPGYYEIVFDIKPAATLDVFRLSNNQIIDILSPPIPESGTLCIEVERLYTWKYDNFRLPFDDKWDPVTYTNEHTFTRDSKTWSNYFTVRDNFLAIQSDLGADNEDTLAYTQFLAIVNPGNSERLIYTTRIGDDPGTNTYGRVQIDKSIAKDKSDIEDAAGGWQIMGTGTVYDNIA